MHSDHGFGRKWLPLTGGSTGRTTDRVEDAAAWLLSALGLFALLGALIAGGSVHAAGAERARIESAELSRFDAVLLEAVPADLGGPAIGMHPLPLVPARYTDRQGVEHVTAVSVFGPLAAGATVTVWLDRNGDVVSAPTDLALITGVVVGLMVAGLAGSFLILGWLALRLVLERINASAWGREWERLEPQWTG